MNKPLRALVIEDSEDDYTLLVRKLAREGEYELTHKRVDTVDGFIKALDEQEWDIIFSDHSMPYFSALHALRILQEKAFDIPFLIVSGAITPVAAVAAMKVGASDYIMKNDLTRLLPAIKRELREAQSRREKRLAESEFQQAQKMESIGRLAGGVVHDFNNIITAILGYSDFLSRGPAQNSAWGEDVKEIIKAAERAASLTRQLLAFSRRQAIQPRVMDLNSEFADLEKMLRRLLGEDIAWETSLASGLGYIMADPGQIQQVIMNLVVNARDSMPTGGKLTVTTENIEFQQPHAEAGSLIPPGSYVAIVVGDIGVGIDEKVKPHLFEPFFTTKEKGKGTGLGLAVIYGIVKHSGGHILVDSAPGKGTTFKIYFPRVEGAVDAGNGKQPVQQSHKGTETILLVDDDAVVRSVIRRILQQNGYSILEVGCGEEALKLAQAHEGYLHLLLADMVLPGINGINLAHRIAPIHPEAKVLLISGYLDSDLGKFVIDEKTPFLQKPFTATALEKMVRKILDSKPVGPAAAAFD